MNNNDEVDFMALKTYYWDSISWMWNSVFLANNTV